VGKIFRTLIVRPLTQDRFRAALTVIAVALGIAVVVAIELAGDAASGSFLSSLTTMVGKTDLEVRANGGIDEKWMGILARLPINARFSPVIQASVDLGTPGFATLYGVDSVAQAGEDQSSSIPQNCGDAQPAAVTRRLGERLPQSFLINGKRFCVARTIDTRASDFIAADIAAVEDALGRYGKLDRIDVVIPNGRDFEEAENRIRSVLPPSYEVLKPGARREENQKMLRAFRWNLRILSYIALLVGAFLIYNTISISVVRRRAEVGILRALGAARSTILLLFLSEALILGLIGAALGLLLGRFLAEAVVGLIGQTVNALYVSSAPAPIALSPAAIGLAFACGIAVALFSAWGPAREAMQAPPVEAMARGSREYRARVDFRRNLLIAALLSGLALLTSGRPAVEGRPVFGYAAALFSVAAASLLAPGVVFLTSRLVRGPLRSIFQAEGLLAPRGLAASLRRTSIIVAALAVATAMMASVGIMVGSFRETVVIWLDSQLRADIYIRASTPPVAGDYPPVPREVLEIVRNVPGVAAVDSFTGTEITFQGLRTTLGGADIDVQRLYGRLRFLSGNHDAIMKSLPNSDRAIVSEPFAEKHHVRVGDRLNVPIGSRLASLTVAGIYYEYSSEFGYIVVDRSTLERYLPNATPSNVAVYIGPGRDAEKIAEEVRARTRRFPVDVALNRDLRRDALEVFDRTFAITWALEVVAIIVAILGAANSLLALVLDRRREFGMLRYLGSAAGQIRRLILIEAALVGLFAIVLGAALGFVLSILLIYVINKQSFGWTIQFHLPALALCSAFVLIWAAAVLAGLYPARVAARLNPIEVIHEE
jgi:putative ABC transport system permease protein